MSESVSILNALKSASLRASNGSKNQDPGAILVQDALKILVDMQIKNSVTRYHDVADTGCLSLLMAELF